MNTLQAIIPAPGQEREFWEAAITFWRQRETAHERYAAFLQGKGDTEGAARKAAERDNCRYRLGLATSMIVLYR